MIKPGKHVKVMRWLSKIIKDPFLLFMVIPQKFSLYLLDSAACINSAISVLSSFILLSTTLGSSSLLKDESVFSEDNSLMEKWRVAVVAGALIMPTRVPFG